MKKVLTLLFSVVMALVVNAQTEVTKFLGIPVDGTKAEMVQKIKAKGFETSSYNRDILEGEFNGEDVEVSVVCNNRKVFRVCVFDAHSCSEADIKIRFNNLCAQFLANPRYFGTDQSIPEDESISYEMLVNKKRYQAAFFKKAVTKILIWGL